MATLIPQDCFTTAYDYTIRFYPRYLTWVQQKLSIINGLGGPATMGPEDKMVVAMNDDTLYAQAFLDLSEGPRVLTIPAYDYTYSALQLDMFGTVLNISGTSCMIMNTGDGGKGGESPGGVKGSNTGSSTPQCVYTLYTEGNTNGGIPEGTIGLLMPYNVTMLIIRVDKYFNNGTYKDVRKEASEFRANLKLQSVDDYTSNPDQGRALILPLVPYYTRSPKMMADEAARLLPGSFIATLQEALLPANTEPAMLNANGDTYANGDTIVSDQDMIDTFNSNYITATELAYPAPANPPVKAQPEFLAEIFRGVQAAHSALVNHWHMSRRTNNWIHFDNIGNWAPSGSTNGSYTYQNYLDRAALNEYIQYGNNSTACYYAHIFVDQNGIPLNGDSTYTITFSNNPVDGSNTAYPQPAYQRFWSITAYTPEAIELVDNQLNKYVVASYTPGLVIDLTGGTDPADGTVTIYVQHQVPTAENTANWLPVPKGPFNLMLRVYGPPQGTTVASPATYVPPPVVRTT
ncbi:DUF1214 domain-containing protein [Candidatus Electronema sp. PJ]|uniref:DUF1214 domain-containing protein n=1 Tax=Candidatus Electronema sp. PJ TaxID=3401572 RepID=UPI003AA85522